MNNLKNNNNFHDLKFTRKGFKTIITRILFQLPFYADFFIKIFGSVVLDKVPS